MRVRLCVQSIAIIWVVATETYACWSADSIPGPSYSVFSVSTGMGAALLLLSCSGSGSDGCLGDASTKTDASGGAPCWTAAATLQIHYLYGESVTEKSETRTFSHGPRRQSTQWFAVADDSYTHSPSSALRNDSPEGAAVIYRADKRRERGLRLLEDIIPQLGDVSTSHRTNAAIKLHSRNCIHGCLLDVDDLPCHG